jgi:hypothetical protein
VRTFSSFLIGAVSLAMASASPAGAATIVVDFEDLDGTGVVIPDSYKGIIWGNKFATYDTAMPPFTPKSGSTVAYFNYISGDMTEGFVYTQPIRFAASVLFKGAYFSGDPGRVTADFYRGGELVGQSSVLTSAVPQFLGGSSEAVDEVRITGGAGNFVLDDLTFETGVVSAVPEPATWAMLLGGFGMLGGAMRSARRKQKVAVANA